MKFFVLLLKKTEYLSALSIRLVYLTGKAKVPIHPKHLISKVSWYRNLLNNKMTILDAGCGSGQHSLKIAPYVKMVIGVDRDLKNFKIAEKSAQLQNIKNIKFQYADLEEKLDFKKETFDLAILFDVLEHIVKRQQFLKEIKRVLKNKGKVIIAIPNTDTSWKRLQRKYGLYSYSDPDHKIEYTKNTIRQELQKAGFQVAKIIPVSYDTPFVGFIDLVGGISLTLYKKLAKWKEKMRKLHPENAIGFEIIATK